MTRRRSSPLGLELVLSVVLALVVLPLLSHGAPVQESHDIQKYSEGCYYNYNHYSEGDRILTNEPCLNCTCHNRMLMCYLRVCPFTKPIGHDCTVEKREDQCCPIVTCPEVPVDIAHHSHQLTTSSPSGTELSIPEKYGCSIDNKFYAEGAQVPSNPNKPCELCYCIRNRTACLMQECTLHIDGCQPIYNKGSCCPVRYNCDHENELLEIEDFSTTTTTIRPTQGYLLQSTTSPSVTTDCFHNNEVYADGASITGKSSCEHCYCMRGDIVCAVQECEMPTLESGAKTCRALPPAAGECCPSNYVCDDDSVTTEGTLIEDMTTILPMIQSNLHESVSQEDVQLQEHIDDKIAVTDVPEKSVDIEDDNKKDVVIPTTISPIAGEVDQPSEEVVKDSEEEKEEEEDKLLLTTVSAIKETSYDITQSPIEHSTTHKTEDELLDSHQDKEDESTQVPIEEDEDKKEDEIEKSTTTVSPVVGDIQKEEHKDDEKLSKIPGISPVEGTTVHSILEEEDKFPPKEEDIKIGEVETTSALPESDVKSTTSSSKTGIESETINSTPSTSDEEPEDIEKTQPAEPAPGTASETPSPTKAHIEPETSTTAQEETSSESVEFSEETPANTVELQDKIDDSVPSTESSTKSPVYEMITEGDDSHVSMPEIGDHKTESSLPKKKPKDELESVETVPTVSDDTKGELPQVITDSTTVQSDTDEGGEINVTIKPFTPLGEVAPHAEEESPIKGDESGEDKTPKPSITNDESTSDESTQGPVREDEIPAVVQEVTETPNKPVSGDISQEEDISGETTALPVRDSSVDEATESEEKEVDVHPTESSDTEKRTTTSRPTRIHIAEEEYSTDIPSEEVEKEHADFTTSVPSVDDTIAIVTEKEAEDIGATIDHTSTAPFTVKSDELEIKGEQDRTTIAPSTAESELSSTEKELLKPEKEILTETSSTPSSYEDQEIPKEDIDMSTPTAVDSQEPNKELEQNVPDSTTVIPSISETGTRKSEEEEIKGKPQHGTDDSTTSMPFVEEEQNNIQPAHGVDEVSTSTPSETEEEEHKKQTEQSPSYSTTEHPYIAKDKDTSTEEDQLKVKPQFDSTEIPAVVDSETSSVQDGNDVTQQPGLINIESTTSSESKPDAPSSEEAIPAIADSEVESAEVEDIKDKPDHSIVDITTVNPVSDSGSTISEEEEVKVQPELSPTVSSVYEPEVTQKQDDKKHMEQELDDSTTVVPSIPATETELSAEEHKEKPFELEAPGSEEDVKQQPEPIDSTTLVPLAPVSDEEVKEASEEALGDLTTASPTSDSEEAIDEEEIKRHPEEGSVDSSTKSTLSVLTETSTMEGDQDKEHKVTTIIPSMDSSEASIPEEEKVKEQPEMDTDGLPTKSSSAIDSETPSQTTSAPVSEEDQKIIVPTTFIPHSIDSDETSTEIDENQEPTEKDDILKSTISPNAYPDKVYSESTDMPEAAGALSDDIIPSAIPGEGDCLANGKTFANNASVPISNECEISCTCISSIVVCQTVQCYEPPEPNNCVLDVASTDKCCPEYICGIDSFAEGQRPSTPEDIEDEEIQFTTLAPAKKYPDISTESAASTQKPDEVVTIIHAEKPIDEDELTKTEQPDMSDESTTPSSIDIELPIITPEEPMSHIKDDKVQEASTEHSEEDLTVEISTTTKQPTTTKPTKQVTGDIEIPIEVTSLPEISVPAKKPEDSTTLGLADEEEEQKATATPMIHEISPAAGVTTESGKPVSRKDEISTKSPIRVDVSETDENIQTTESTLEKEITTLSAAHSESSSKAPTVIDRDDSALSEETPETSDEGSNESGEETESEEDTKSPMLQKDEDKKLTTSKPLVSEHAGDIEPIDESTTIPELDYQTPEMPEDLSHTKVEEKPVKPIVAIGSGEKEEGEEVSDKATTAPATAITTDVESAEEDSNEGEDIPSSETDEDKKTDESTEQISPHQATPTSSTASPNKPEEDQDPETATEPHKDGIANQTGSPLPVSTDEADLEKNTTPIESSTSALDEEKLIVPTEDAKPSGNNEDEISSTSVPATEELSIEGSGADIAEEESDEKKTYGVSSTSSPTMDRTLAPVSNDESIEDKVNISSQTIAPAADDQTIKGSGTTSVPGGEFDISSTSAPAIDEHLPEGSGAQISEEDDDIISQTNASHADKQPPVSIPEEENKTISPADEEHSVEGSGSPISGTQAADQENEIISQTSAPAISNQPTVSDKEEDKSDVTVSPTDEDHTVEGSGAPISEEKYDDKKDKSEIPTSTPTTKDDSAEVTVTPVSKDSSQTIAPSIANTIVPAAGTESEEDISSQTSAPSVSSEAKPSAPSSEENTSDEDKTEIDFEDGTEVSTEEKAHGSTAAPEVEKDANFVTVLPVAGDKFKETELPEDKKTTVSVPTSEEEIELDVTTISTKIKDTEIAVDKTTEESITPKSSEESVDVTETPSMVTSIQESEDDFAGATGSPETSTPAKIMETNEEVMIPTIVPIKGIPGDGSLDTTELPSSSTSAKPMDSFDKDIEATKSPQVDLDEDNMSLATNAPAISESSSVDSEPASPVTLATPKLDEEVLSQTQVPVSADEHGSEAEQPTELPHFDVQEPHVDKTLLTTESPLAGEETGTKSPESDSEEKLGQKPTVKPPAQTEKPVTLKEETATKEAEDSETTDSTLMPQIISSHEETPQSGKPESGDQILIQDMVTAHPSVEDVPAQTESSTDKNMPSLEESNITTHTPIVSDISEIDEKPDKTVSIEDESSEDMGSKTPSPTAQTHKPTSQTESPVFISSEEQDSSENDKPEEVKPVAQTETPSSEEVPSKVAYPDVTISSVTEQPVALDESTNMVSSETITTGKPAEDTGSSESEEDGDYKVSSTVAPLEKITATPSAGDIHAGFEHTSTEKSHEGEELTEAPKDDTKIQTIAEFVTERLEDMTTVLPTKGAGMDKETVSEHPVSPLSEEPTTSSSEEEDSEKPQVPITIENVSPLTSAEESDEKTVAPDIQTETDEEKHQPTIMIDESEEKTQAPVIPSEIDEESDERTQEPESSTEVTEEDHKHEVQPTILPEDTEDKTQVPETLSAVAEEDQKKQVQPTEGSLTQSTSEKPISPSIEEESVEDLPKPIVSDKQAVEDSLLITTVNPLLPNVEDKYATSQPEFNASMVPIVHDKIEEDLGKPIVPDEQQTVDDNLPITTINPLLPNIEDKYTTSQPESNASIAPSIHDVIAEDLPKPIVMDEKPIAEEESPLSTTVHPLFPHIEQDRTTSPPQPNATDKIDDKITESIAHPIDESQSSPIPTTEPPTTSQSITNAPTSHYQPPGYGQVPPHYPSYAEDEYTDEDETEVFGPGTCRYGGKLFVSAQQIPRDDPCDFCFCFRSDIICLQQSCPPPISGCHEEPISGFCCPRYECPVSMATTLNITTSTTTTSTTLPPHFLHHAYRGAAAKNGCHISGKSYKVGDKIDSASGPCMHCTCGGDGQMKCDPKTCSPEPMLRQMIAVVASRRR